MTLKSSDNSMLKMHPYLICPLSHDDLLVSADAKGLVCKRCNKIYPVINGVPAMLPNQGELNASQEYFETESKPVNKRNFDNYFERRWAKLLSCTNVGRMGTKSRILECGAGEGFGTQLIRAKTGADVYAMDYSMAACQTSSKHPRQTSCLCQADSCALPFRDDFFDFIFGNALLHHIEDQKKAVEESVRVSREGSYIVFIEPNRFHPLQLLNVLMCGEVERGTLHMSPRKIKRYFLETGRVQDVQLVPIFTMLYTYQSFPPDFLFPLVKFMEPLFDYRGICTSYFIIARRMGNAQS